jgi:hypothetical protein
VGHHGFKYRRERIDRFDGVARRHRI